MSLQRLSNTCEFCVAGIKALDRATLVDDCCLLIIRKYMLSIYLVFLASLRFCTHYVVEIPFNQSFSSIGHDMSSSVD